MGKRDRALRAGEEAGNYLRITPHGKAFFDGTPSPTGLLESSGYRKSQNNPGSITWEQLLSPPDSKAQKSVASYRVTRFEDGFPD
jgi:hypothetical protein